MQGGGGAEQGSSEAAIAVAQQKGLAAMGQGRQEGFARELEQGPEGKVLGPAIEAGDAVETRRGRGLTVLLELPCVSGAGSGARAAPGMTMLLGLGRTQKGTAPVA